MQMERLAQKHGLKKLLPALLHHAQPAIRFSLANERAGRSRFGGMPLLPRDFAWPSYEPRPLELPASLLKVLGRSRRQVKPGLQPLDFLLQVDLAELAPFAAAAALPKTGLLTFFYDVIEQPWGFDPTLLGGFRVALFEGTELFDAAPPRPAPFAARALRFAETLTVPHYGSRAYDSLARDATLPDTYVDFAIELEQPQDAPAHRLLGHAANIQGDMQLEAQLVSHGLYCGDGSGYGDPQAAALARGADDWQLLLQLDSDESAAMTWGDVGRLFFWIRRQDLAARRFDRCWMGLQCS